MKQLYNAKTANLIHRRSLRKNATVAELRLWPHLRGRSLDGFRFLRQFGFGGYILDFYCSKKKLAIEIDGQHHGTDSGRAYDEIRSKYLAATGVRVLRFWNSEVMENLEGVLERIRSELVGHNPSG
jgi:very-short-patch-repair endonuclease